MLVDCLLSVDSGFYVGRSFVDLVCGVRGDCGFYSGLQIVSNFVVSINRLSISIGLIKGLFAGWIVLWFDSCVLWGCIDFARFWGIGSVFSGLCWRLEVCLALCKWLICACFVVLFCCWLCCLRMWVR